MVLHKNKDSLDIGWLTSAEHTWLPSPNLMNDRTGLPGQVCCYTCSMSRIRGDVGLLNTLSPYLSVGEEFGRAMQPGGQWLLGADILPIAHIQSRGFSWVVEGCLTRLETTDHEAPCLAVISMATEKRPSFQRNTTYLPPRHTPITARY